MSHGSPVPAGRAAGQSLLAKPKWAPALLALGCTSRVGAAHIFGIAQLPCLPPPGVLPAHEVSAYPMSLGSSVPACLAIGGVTPPVGVSLADTRRAAGATAGRLPRRPTCCFAALPASSLAHSIARGTIRALARVPLPLASLTFDEIVHRRLLLLRRRRCRCRPPLHPCPAGLAVP